MSLRVFVVAAAALALSPVAAWSQGAPAQVVKERQEIFKNLWPNHYDALSKAARGQAGSIAEIPAQADRAVEMVKKVSALFPPGSGRDAVPSSRAKPEIWSQRKEFDDAFTTLINETTALGRVAQTGNADAVRAQFAKVAEACGACHGAQPKSAGKFRFEEP